MKRFSKTDVVALAILILATALRFQDLPLRPFHHDEGVNGFFLTRLLREGAFLYDPSNYHGPTLYYLTLPVVAVFGLSDEAVRGTTAFFGALTVLVLWRFLAPVGSVFALTAMALLATSPGAVFFSRYFIHESLFVAFTMCSLALMPRRGGHQSWRFIGAGIALGLLFATKETAFVSVLAVGGGAVAASWLVEGVSPRALVASLKSVGRDHAENIVNGVLAFTAAAGLMYSSFFRNPGGVLDAFRTFAFWTKTAVRDHNGAWNQHVLWLNEADPALLYLGALGAALALILRRSFTGVLAAVWTLLIFFAYSMVSYKTPWLGLNMLLPLAICSGYLFHELAGVRFLQNNLSLAPVAVFIAAGATGLSATRSNDLEMRRYDDENHPYIYAHTQRPFLEFVQVIKERARELGTGTDTTIAVFAPENWPLAWYLRDYTKAGYWGQIKSDLDVDMVIGSLEQDAPIALKLGGDFDRIGPYKLRGVVDLVLYARKVTP